MNINRKFVGPASSTLSVAMLALALQAGVPVTAGAASPAPPRSANFSALLAYLAPQAATPPAKHAPTPEMPLPEGKGADTTKRVCAGCHGTNIWVKQRHTPEKWSSIVDNMVAKGMEASDDDLAVVNQYLSTYLGPPAPDATVPPPPTAAPQK